MATINLLMHVVWCEGKIAKLTDLNFWNIFSHSLSRHSSFNQRYYRLDERDSLTQRTHETDIYVMRVKYFPKPELCPKVGLNGHRLHQTRISNVLIDKFLGAFNSCFLAVQYDIILVYWWWMMNLKPPTGETNSFKEGKVVVPSCAVPNKIFRARQWPL